MCQLLVDLDKYTCGHDHATAQVQRGGCPRRTCSNYEPIIRLGSPRFPCESCRQDDSMERLDEWVNMGRGRMRGYPPGLTRYGEDDARDYIELDREEHRFQVEYNGRGFEPSFAGLSHRLSGAMMGLITAALRNLFEPAAPLLPPLLPHPPMRPPFGWGRSRRREHLYRQSSWFDPEFGSANFRSNYSARSEHRYHRDNDDGYFDVDNDSTTFYDPYDMPLGHPRVRFA